MLLLTSYALATVTSSRGTVEADNVLRYSMRVQTTELATVAIQIWESGSSPTSGWTTPYGTTNTRVSQVRLWGLEPGTRYSYRILVDPQTGSSYADTTIRRLTTSALPTDFPTFTVTDYGGTPGFEYLLFNTVTTGREGLLVILDTEGDVVWYEENAKEYYALWYSADEEAVYAILDADEILRVEMDGDITLQWTTADVLQDVVHHEVFNHGGTIYTLTTQSFTGGARTYLEDGIQGYDEAGTLVFEWWPRADAGMDVVTHEPFGWNVTGGPVAESFPPTALDWMHTNSLQIRDEGGDLKAYLSNRNLYQVSKVDLATGALEWLMGQNGTGSATEDGDFTFDAASISSTWWALQHNAHHEDDGKFYLFDNTSGGDSRGLELDIDETAMELRIDREVDLSEFVDFAFTGECDRESSAYRTPSDHFVLTCGPELFIADYDADDVLAWSLDVSGVTVPIYRAIPLQGIGN